MKKQKQVFILNSKFKSRYVLIIEWNSTETVFPQPLCSRKKYFKSGNCSVALSWNVESVWFPQRTGQGNWINSLTLLSIKSSPSKWMGRTPWHFPSHRPLVTRRKIQLTRVDFNWTWVFWSRRSDVCMGFLIRSTCFLGECILRRKQMLRNWFGFRCHSITFILRTSSNNSFDDLPLLDALQFSSISQSFSRYKGSLYFPV